MESNETKDTHRCPVCGAQEDQNVPGPPRIPGQWYCVNHRHIARAWEAGRRDADKVNGQSKDTETSVAAIRERRAKIRNPPWLLGPDSGCVYKVAATVHSRNQAKALVMDAADAEFIAHAPADIDFLLTALDEAAAVKKYLRADLAAARSQPPKESREMKAKAPSCSTVEVPKDNSLCGGVRRFTVEAIQDLLQSLEPPESDAPVSEFLAHNKRVRHFNLVSRHVIGQLLAEAGGAPLYQRFLKAAMIAKVREMAPPTDVVTVLDLVIAELEKVEVPPVSPLSTEEAEKQNEFLLQFRKMFAERYEAKHGVPLTWDSGWAWSLLAFVDAESLRSPAGGEYHAFESKAHDRNVCLHCHSSKNAPWHRAPVSSPAGGEWDAAIDAVKAVYQTAVDVVKYDGASATYDNMAEGVKLSIAALEAAKAHALKTSEAEHGRQK